jgi:hypothetical protein
MLSIGRVEAGLKFNPHCFFKFANLKRNSSDYPSAMFLGGACALNAQEIADLFGEHFQDFLWTTVLRIIPLFR